MARSLKSYKQKRDMGTLASITGLVEDERAYRKARGRSLRQVRNAKAKYIIEQDRKWGNDSRKFWDKHGSYPNRKEMKKSLLKTRMATYPAGRKLQTS